LRVRPANGLGSVEGLRLVLRFKNSVMVFGLELWLQ
jgi:hypothetical protein